MSWARTLRSLSAHCGTRPADDISLWLVSTCFTVYVFFFCLACVGYLGDLTRCILSLYGNITEERDNIHIVDTTSDYKKAQKIDFIGDISGISLTPDAEGLFVGVSSVDFS